MLTVSREALVVLLSSAELFFPVNKLFRLFLTSALNTTWNRKMSTPWRRGGRGREGGKDQIPT